VALRPADQSRLQTVLRQRGRVILALDGLQDAGHAVLYTKAKVNPDGPEHGLWRSHRGSGLGAARLTLGRGALGPQSGERHGRES
jgi:hypothetical protein